jgi:integrase
VGGRVEPNFELHAALAELCADTLHTSAQEGDVRPGKTGFIFTSEVGTVIDPRNFDRWWSRQCTKAHMPKGYTFHRLRHDYASILARQNVASRVAQDTMRHAQYSTTASIYQHVATEDMFAAASRGRRKRAQLFGF